MQRLFQKEGSGKSGDRQLKREKKVAKAMKRTSQPLYRMVLKGSLYA
jgi:hypothetical protein